MAFDESNIIGRVISNRYEIERFLGSGGMASVYVAKDLLLGGSYVAIKILHIQLQHKSSQYQRFLREVQLMRLVTHPNVVRTYDVGHDNGVIYFTMEFVDGVSLGTILNTEKALPLNNALYFTLQICYGLRAIHKCDIVHRDLKPPNILIVNNDTVKITDFGVARPKVSYLTDDNNFCGTLPYVAPEVFTSDKITPATDCYSLGISLYEMVTGDLPFNNEVPAKIIALHLQKPPPHASEKRSEIPTWLDETIIAMLDKNPAARPSIDSLIRLLSTKIEGYSVSDSADVIECSKSVQLEQSSPTIGDFNLTIEKTKQNLQIDPQAQTLAEPKEGIAAGRKVFSIKNILSALFISIFIAATHLLLFRSDFGANFELAVLDFWFPLRGVEKVPDDVVIVAMNEQSYSNLDIPLTAPWPRKTHAELLQRLAEYGVKRVVFDILFIGEGAAPEENAHFAAAIAEVPTVLGSSFMQIPQTTLTGSYALETYQEPYDLLLKNAAATGLVNMPADFGRIRRFNTERSEHYKDLLSLDAAGAGAYESDLALPEEYDLINYYGPPRTIKIVSYESVLEVESPLPAELFENKVVVVGLLLQSSSGPNQKEEFESPFSGRFVFGTEIHATAISNIINHEWIKRATPEKEVLALSILAVLATLLIIFLPTKLKIGFSLLLILCWGITSFTLFLFHFFVPGSILTILIIPFVTLLSFVIKPSPQGKNGE